MKDVKVLGPCVSLTAIVLVAAPALAQTPARDAAPGPSRNLGSENREVVDEEQPRRYEVYDPGAGYGGNLYLNDQYFLRSNPQGEASPQANRSGLQARRPQDVGETQAATDRPAAPAMKHHRGEIVRVQAAAASDRRPAGTELVVDVGGSERTFWLADVAFAANLPTLTPGEAVTLIGEPAATDGAEGFDVRVIESPSGRVQLPYYRFGQLVEAKLVSTRTQAGAEGKPSVVIGTLGLPDARSIDVGLGTTEQLAAAGVTPSAGAAVRIEGFLRSTPEQSWTFVVQDVKVDGESVRRSVKTPAASTNPSGDAGP